MVTLRYYLKGINDGKDRSDINEEHWLPLSKEELKAVKDRLISRNTDLAKLLVHSMYCLTAREVICS